MSTALLRFPLTSSPAFFFSARRRRPSVHAPAGWRCRRVIGPALVGGGGSGVLVKCVGESRSVGGYGGAVVGEDVEVASIGTLGIQEKRVLKSDSSSDQFSNEDAETIEEGESPKRVTHSIIFATAEADPYSKTGGLGDVCGSLPIAFASRDHRVMVVTPRYMNGVTDERFSNAIKLQSVSIPCFGGLQEVTFFHEYRAGVDWVFVDHPSYHRPGNPYGDSNGAFSDNQFRFVLLCHAACEAPLVLPLGGFTYGEKCLFIANDWHAGLVPVKIP